MKNLFYCIIGLFLISCTFQKEMEYVTYDLSTFFSNCYEISVPKNLANSNYKSFPGFGAWMNENDALFLRVKFELYSAKEKMEMMISEKKEYCKSNGFYITEENVTDSTATITFSKETLHWQYHTITKQVELGYYIIELEGLNGCTCEDIQKIASSIKLRITNGEVPETEAIDITETKYATYKLNTQKSEQIQNTSSVILDKTFGNQYFSLNYPSDWEIINEDANTIDDIKISIHVMQRRINDIDFLPSVNIIKSKHIESTQQIASITIKQAKQVFSQVKEGNFKDVVISGLKGTCLTYNCNVQGYVLEFYQYFIKKADNTTYTITCAIDYFKRDTQKPIVDAIVKSLVIK